MVATKHFLSALALLALPLPAFAQDSAATQSSAEDPCAEEGACRHLTSYTIEDPDGESHTFEVDVMLPWVMQGNVVLTPGEAVVVRLVETSSGLAPLLVHSGWEAIEATLRVGEVRFIFGPFDRGTVMLTVHNAYPESLDYAALMVTTGGGPERTSVCTLTPGVTAFESWQQPIYQLALWSFRPAEEHACHVVEVDAEIGEHDPD